MKKCKIYVNMKKIKMTSVKYSERSGIRHRRLTYFIPFCAISMEKLYDLYVKSYSLNAENAPEFFHAVGDIYATPEFQSTGRFIQHANITLKQHMMSVAYLSYLITKKKNLDHISAARAAMVHDLVYYDWHEAGDGTHRLHGYRHPGFALKNAEKIFPLSPLQKNIIHRHMWPLTPIPPKYRESWCVCLADKYCAVNEILIKKIPSYERKFKDDIKKART